MSDGFFEDIVASLKKWTAANTGGDGLVKQGLVSKWCRWTVGGGKLGLRILAYGCSV